MTDKLVQIHLRCTPEQGDSYARLARLENRSRNNWITTILDREIASQNGEGEPDGTIENRMD